MRGGGIGCQGEGDRALCRRGDRVPCRMGDRVSGGEDTDARIKGGGEGCHAGGGMWCQEGRTRCQDEGDKVPCRKGGQDARMKRGQGAFL